jgi:hypothetical protein
MPNRRQLLADLTVLAAGRRPSAATPDHGFVHVRYADPEKRGCLARRHSGGNRRQNPLTQILRISLTRSPAHGSLQLC